MHLSVKPTKDGGIKIPANLLDIFEGKELFTFPIKLRGVNTVWVGPEYAIRLQPIFIRDYAENAYQKRVWERLFFSSVFSARIRKNGRLMLPKNFSFSTKELYIYMTKIYFEYYMIISEDKIPSK